MITIIALLVAYLYSDILLMFFWAKVLGRKYTWKITLAVSLIRYVIGSSIKIFCFLNYGLNIVGILSLFAFFTFIIIIVILYKGSIWKQLLSFWVITMVMNLIDSLGMDLTTFLFGEFDFMNLDSYQYTIFYICISYVFITISSLGVLFVWKKVEKMDWSLIGLQYLCILLPISQFILLNYYVNKYLLHAEQLPITIVIGVILAFLADCYMLFLIYRLNIRKHAEIELHQVLHQYEMEQIHYNELKKQQDEMSKIRHDFQNYILTIEKLGENYE